MSGTAARPTAPNNAPSSRYVMILTSIPTGTLSALLCVLFVLSAFFSGSETALMSINRYRLANLAKQGNRRARRVLKLLEKPDRLIGLILFCNNLANILIAQLATLLGYRLYGDVGIAAATGILTFLLLVFAELAPKTLSVLHPQAVAMPAALIYTPLMVLLYPIVWFINLFSSALLKMLGVARGSETINPLDREELRTVLVNSKKDITPEYQNMLLGILDLEKKTVEDIMIPRSEIFGIDLDADIDDIENQLLHTNYTRIPVYQGDVNNVIGTLHLREILPLLRENAVNKDTLKKAARTPSYIPENSALRQALFEFKDRRRRLSLVVDEYGDVQGLITLEDLLEEIVGEFTSDPATYDLEIKRQNDGSVIVDGGCHIRELNTTLNWQLPEHGPKTVNGLVLEYLESIPEIGTCMLLNGHPLEVMKTHQNAIKSVKIAPKLKHPTTMSSRRKSNNPPQRR